MREVVKKRGIKWVWHFTKLDNVDSILEHGLLTRRNLENEGYEFEYNDEYRLDGQRGSICCSIGHPNYKMFYSLRMQDPDPEWAVIAIDARILWEKDCLFCHTNAASTEVTSIPVDRRRGEDAFEKMFEEVDGKPSRKVLRIDEKCPTDPQAEVLVLDDIEPDYILGVATKSIRARDELLDMWEGYQIKYVRALFNSRIDHEHW